MAGAIRQRVRRFSRETRIWGYFLVYCVLILLKYAYVIAKERSNLGSLDFPAFYTAGMLLRTGKGHELYNLCVQSALQEPLMAEFTTESTPTGFVLQPYVNPPFFAPVFVPLSYLSLEHAFWIWVLFNLGLTLVMVWLLLRFIRMSRWTCFVAAALIVLTFSPVLQTLLKGQNSLLVTFLLTMVFLLLKRGHEGTAGAVLSLGLIKPHLIIVLPPFLFAQRKWRALGSFGLGAMVLLVLSLLLTGVHGAQDYIRLFEKGSQYTTNYNRALFLHNWSGFVARSIVFLGVLTRHNFSPRISLAMTAGLTTLSIALLLTAWWKRRNARDSSLELLFALTITTTLLISPHVHDHDLSLLVLVAFLIISYARKEGLQTIPLLLTLIGHVLFLLPQSVGGSFGTFLVYPHVTVLVLALIAVAIWYRLQQPFSLAALSATIERETGI